jgi:hypothetical protein
VANEYAEHVLHSGPDEAVLGEILEKHEAIGSEQTLSHDYKCLIGEAFYDAETGDDKELADALMDAHGLLFELEEELTTILEDKHSHVALGFAYSQNQVKVIEIFSDKELRVTQLSATEDEGVEIRGTVLSMKDKGLYAIRIVNAK